MRFFNNRPLVITLIVAAVLVILILVVPGSMNSGPLNVVGDAVNGSQSIISRGFSAVGNFFGGIFSPSDLEQENAELREKVMQLERRQQEYTELERTVEVLQEQVDYKLQNPEYKYRSASVIAKDPGYYFDVFTINVGHKHGVKEGAAVITPKGLVGRIIEVGGSSSKVMAIIDSRSYVSCTISRTRDNCMAKGGLQLSDESGLCELEYLPIEADLLMAGDKVVTNSLGTESFPKGLVVGEIKQVGNPNASSESGRRTLMKPAVDFLHLEEVMVVMLDDVGDEELELEDPSTTQDETPSPVTTETDEPTESTTPWPEDEDGGDDNGDGGDDTNGDDGGDGDNGDDQPESGDDT